jgi:hypothetical protein
MCLSWVPGRSHFLPRRINLFSPRAMDNSYSTSLMPMGCSQCAHGRPLPRPAHTFRGACSTGGALPTSGGPSCGFSFIRYPPNLSTSLDDCNAYGYGVADFNPRPLRSPRPRCRRTEVCVDLAAGKGIHRTGGHSLSLLNFSIRLLEFSTADIPGVL